MTAVDITLHFDIADEEPGVPQTEKSLKDWLIPDLLAAIRRVIGHPGDSAVVWAGDPRYPEYEIAFPDAETCHEGICGKADPLMLELVCMKDAGHEGDHDGVFGKWSDAEYAEARS